MSSTDAFRSLEDLPPLGPIEQDPERAGAYDAAYREGLASGIAEGRSRGEVIGRDEARREVLAASGPALDALIVAADELRNRDAAGIESLHHYALDLALGIAEAVIGREIDTAIDPGRDALARALAVTPATGAIVARLHPEDLAIFGGVDDLIGDRELRLIADPAVGRGGCLVEVDATRVDARLAAALDRVRLELAGASTPPFSGSDATTDVAFEPEKGERA